MRMKYCQIILLCLAGPFSDAQEVIDLVDCQDCLWTVKNNRIASWNIDNEMAELNSGGIENSNSGISIGYVNVSSDTILNTFITADWVVDGEYEKIKYWNGTVWVDFIDAPNGKIQGMGSYEHHLYIKSQNTQSSMIHYYDGDTMLELDLPFDKFGIADIAVDAFGNAWYPSMTTIGSDSVIDSIFVFNADQTNCKKYPLSESISGLGSYGTAMVHDTLYIGFRHTNPTYPNQVISIILKDDVVQVADKVIRFDPEESGFNDLASKYPTRQIIDTIAIPTACKIYPNPFIDYLFIERTDPDIEQYQIYSSIGEFVYEEILDGYKSRLDLKFLTQGTYYLRLGTETKKIIKVD